MPAHFRPPAPLVLLLPLLVGVAVTARQPQQQLSYYDSGASASSFGEPVFRLEPAPNVIEFSSARGLTIPCLASGSPRPQIRWFAGANSLDQGVLSASDTSGFPQQRPDAPRPAGNLTDLRLLLNGGQTLRLLPFGAADYRPEVHSTEYRCVASNQLGAIHSRSVQVQATVRPAESGAAELRVNDEFVALNAPAVLRCRAAGSRAESGERPELQQLASASRQLEWVASESAAGATGSLQVLASVGGSHSGPSKAAGQQANGQRKFTAFGSGELHFHQVELADLQRTYGCRLSESGRSAAAAAPPIVASSNLAQLIATDSIGRPPVGADKPAAGSQQQQAVVLHSVGQTIAWDHASWPKNQPPDDETSSRLMLPCAVRLPTGRQPQRQPADRWYFQPAGQRTARPLALSQLAAARSIPIVSADSLLQPQGNATKRARVATMNLAGDPKSGKRETRLVVGPTHLTIEWPRRWLSGRYLYQLEEDAETPTPPNDEAGGQRVMCDINVIIRSPIKLKMAATLNLGRQQSSGQQSADRPQAQPLSLPLESSWLTRIVSWFTWPIAANTFVSDPQNPERETSPKSGQSPRRRRSSPQVPRQEDFALRNPLIELSPNRVQVRGAGLLPEPPIVRVGDRLQLECRGSGYPIEGVKWFRNGQAINTQSSQDFQVEISGRPLQQVRFLANGSADADSPPMELDEEPPDNEEEADEGDELADYATESSLRTPVARDQETSPRALSVLTIRQVQPKDAGLQMFECFAYNSLGEQTRAGQLVLVAERRLIDWARAQCPLSRSAAGELRSSLPPEVGEFGLQQPESWDEESGAGSWLARDEALEGRPAELGLFRRQNPMLRALVLESEPLELRCPARSSAESRVEWRRIADDSISGARPAAGSGASQQVGFNQLFGSDSRFVINGSSLQIRAPSKRHDESLYLCARRVAAESTGPPEANAETASGAHELDSSSLHQSSSCRRLLSSLGRATDSQQQQQAEEATAALQLSSISIRIVAKPRIEPFEFSRNLEEGMRAVVVCAVVSGQSPMDVTWFKDGELLLEDEQIGVDQANGFSSTLTFARISPAHSGHYTCVAANAFGSANHTSRLLVNVAPYFTEPPKSTQAILGANLLVDCRASGQPSPQIRWRKLVAVSGSLAGSSAPSLANGKQVAPFGSNLNSLSVAKLLESVDSMDGAQLTLNSGGASSAASSAKLEFRIVTSNSHIQILENGSMIIKDVELADSSRYACQAFNGINPSLSEVIDIQVLSPAQFDVNYETVSVKRDSMVKFNCAPRGDQPLRIEWYKETSRLVALSNLSSTSDLVRQQSKYSEVVHLAGSTGGELNGGAPSQRHNNLVLELPQALAVNKSPAQVHPPGDSVEPVESSELFINYADRGDTGTFVCVASNPFGRDELTYRLVVQEPPDTPPNVSVQNVQASSLKLLWTSPFDGNLALSHFIIEYRRLIPQVASKQLAAMSHYDSNNKELDGAASSRNSEWVRLVVPTSKLISDPIAVSSSAAANQRAPIGSSQAAGQQQQVQAQFSIVLHQLAARSTYQIRVAAVNAIGQGGFSPIHTATTAEEPPTSRADDLRAQPLSSSAIKVLWRGPANMEEQVAPVRGYYISHRKLGANSDGKAPGSPEAGGRLWLATVPVSASNATYLQQQQQPQQPQQPQQALELGDSRFGPSPGGAGVAANYEHQLNNLEKSTKYEIQVQPYNSVGVGPASETVGQTLKFDRPHQPNLKLVGARRQSLELKWSVDTEQPIMGFSLFYKCEYDDWREIQLAVIYHYVIENLRCGNKYQIYLSAFNVAGRSDPSDVLSVRTEGTAPVAPDKSAFFRPNITEVVLDMGGWRSGGCPISSFTIQFKRLHDSNWFILSEGATPFASSDKITIPDLTPATWYKLLVTALNEAGSTNAEFLFSTLNAKGEPIAPDFPLDQEVGRVFTAASGAGRSVLNSLSQLLFASSGPNGPQESQLLLPMSCVLLLLVTSLASYLYYSHNMSASRSQSSGSSTSSSTSNKKLNGGAGSSLDRSPSLLMSNLHGFAPGATNEDKRLLPQQQANVHLLHNHYHHQTLPLNSAHSCEPQSAMLADMHSFAGHTHQRVRANSLLFGPATSNCTNSSSVSTHSTNCHFDGSSSQASTSGASGTSGCGQLAGKLTTKLQLIDESSMMEALQQQQQPQHYGAYESQAQMSPAHNSYSAGNHMADEHVDMMDAQLDGGNLIESNLASLFQPPPRAMGTSSSFVSAADLVKRQQQSAEPIYQRLDKFQGCTLATCKQPDHFATMNPQVKAQTLRFISSHFSQDQDQQMGNNKSMTMTLQRPAANLNFNDPATHNIYVGGQPVNTFAHELQHQQQQQSNAEQQLQQQLDFEFQDPNAQQLDYSAHGDCL